MKKTLAVLLGLLLAAPAYPQQQFQVVETLVLASVWDADSGTLTYCNTLGVARNLAGRNKTAPNSSVLSTSGSSTTVTATRDGFANVAVGDPLWINDDGVQLQRVVTARASATSITVNAAVDITGASWEYRTLTCGTTDTSGAVPVSGYNHLTFQVILAQENSTSTDYEVECRLYGPGTAWTVLSPIVNDTGVFNDVVATDLGFDECRVGVRVNTDDGGDTGVNAEQYTILLQRRK